VNRFRFYITILSSRVEVHPLNHWKTSLVDERQEGPHYRRRFNGTLTFTDNNGSDDFSMLYLIETASPCERLILEIEEKDSAADTYHDYWEGHFSTTDGKFDLDKCTFEITPLPYDSYTQFDIYGDVKYNILSGVLLEVTTSTVDPVVSYTRNRWLMDVIEYLVHNIAPTATIESDIFTNVYNYASFETNYYTLLTIAQKSDIKRPTSTDKATIAMLSFNELMTMLRGMFNVYWTYDYDTDVFRLEHITYWYGEAGLDLRTQAMSQQQNKYNYDLSEMYRTEQWSFMEAADNNFTTHTIWIIYTL